MFFRDFQELLGMVKGKTNRVVVPGANNVEAMEAIKMADENGLISEGILIGDETLVSEMARSRGLNMSKFRIMDCRDVAQMCTLAVDQIVSGNGDFLVKGLVDTRYYLKAVLNKEAGLVAPGALLSHFVLFKTARYKKIFAIADAAIMINPTLEQKVKITENTIAVLRMLGVETPKVAMVCPVEKVNDKIPSTVDAAEIVKMSRAGTIKHAVIEGPYDVYMTFSRELANEKGMKDGVVPGDPDAVIMPDLNTGNAVYKSISFFGEGVNGAAVVAGANVPVILPSRADAPAVKLYSIALASYLKGKKMPV